MSKIALILNNMKSKRFLFTLILLTFIIITALFVYDRKFRRKFSPPRIVAEDNIPHKATNPIDCVEGDLECEKKNETISINNLQGRAVEYAKHQCDGPRECPEPNDETNKAAIEAITKYSNNSKLELIRVTGINPAGFIYYCAEDGRCWSYNTNSQNVISTKDEESKTPITQ